MPHPPPKHRHFVGRLPELTRFREILEDPTGRAILITGQQGMGKSSLARRMLEIARDHPTLTCGTVSYEVTATDPPESVMERMLEDGWAATQIEGSFSADPHRRRQWKTLFTTVVPKGKDLLALTSSLERNPKVPARDQLVTALTRLSDELPDHHRVLFLVDSEKEMQEKSDQPWRLVVDRLPPKILLLFAQRPEDALASSPPFRRLTNVALVPEQPLGTLAPGDVDQLLELAAPGLDHSLDELRTHFAQLDGHPYAVAASLDLLLDEEIPLDDLPTDPHGITGEQWTRVQRDDDAARLFEAHAVLEVPIPDDLACEVADLQPRTQRRLLADPYLAGLLLNSEAPEAAGAPEAATTAARRRIYHSLLADAVRAELTEDELQTLHRRAIDAYRERFEADETPDPLPALRLPEHILAAEGPEAFAESVANFSSPRLRRFGLLQDAENLLGRAHSAIPGQTALEADLLNELGGVHRIRGGFDRAEEIHNRSLKIHKKLGRLEGMANAYGNLGAIHHNRGNLDRAEEMLNLSLEIEKKLGRPEGMAADYGNLGALYHTRGDLDRAEKMLNRSLEIEKKLGHLEGMANAYTCLGLIHQTRGNLDGAEEMHNRSLEINENLGRPEGMAIDYGNLGVIHLTRRDLERAEEMFSRSLKINEKLGRLEGTADAYGNLGVIRRARGNLDRAEEMHNRSLEIDEELGRLEGIAITLGNLGRIAHDRGDHEQARAHWSRSLDLYRQLGAPHQVERVQQSLDSLDADPEL